MVCNKIVTISNNLEIFTRKSGIMIPNKGDK